MKDLTLSQKIEVAIALNDRIKVLQKLVDDSKKHEIECSVQEQGLADCKTVLSLLGYKL